MRTVCCEHPDLCGLVYERAKHQSAVKTCSPPHLPLQGHRLGNNQTRHEAAEITNEPVNL
jgi:hypothetical protein